MSMILNSLPDDLAAARILLRNWRATRRRGSAMPDELWTAAVDVARKHGAYFVSRALPIDYGALKRRLETKANERPSAFVELAPLTQTRPATLDEIVVDIADGSGARMLVRLPADAGFDLVGLVSAFRWRAS